MSRRMRVLSGDDIISIFEQFGFILSYGKGSHCKLSRINNGESQVIIVPRHKEITKGTLKSIYRKALPYIGEKELNKVFYNK